MSRAPERVVGVECVGLRHSFGRQVALEGVDLSLGPGIVGLLGPNGAGKTTLLRILATALAPQHGDVRLHGLDPSLPGQRHRVRQLLGYLPQDPQLYPSFTAFELVDYVAVLKQHTNAATRSLEVRRVLEAVGLADRMHTRIKRLSGGMRQRVALAAALLGDPRLLVLDEPATGLDPVQRMHLRSLLSRCGSRGTVVLSTHNTAEVAALCQHVVVMGAGRVLFSGTPAELAAVAEGGVWESEGPASGATHSWVTGNGRHRHVGSLPAGARAVEASMEDGYLLLSGGRS